MIVDQTDVGAFALRFSSLEEVMDVGGDTTVLMRTVVPGRIETCFGFMPKLEILDDESLRVTHPDGRSVVVEFPTTEDREDYQLARIGGLLKDPHAGVRPWSDAQFFIAADLMGWEIEPGVVPAEVIFALPRDDLSGL